MSPSTSVDGEAFRASVARAGSDITIISYSKMLIGALEAAVSLEQRGVSAEVIDLRCLAPLDLATVYASIRKTHHVVVAHEAVITGGAGAEVTARIQEDIFDELDAPVARVGAPFAPVPAGTSLEEAFVPGQAEIIGAVDRTLALNSG